MALIMMKQHREIIGGKLSRLTKNAVELTDNCEYGDSFTVAESVVNNLTTKEGMHEKVSKDTANRDETGRGGGE